jgi:hypothetical protein
MTNQRYAFQISYLNPEGEAHSIRIALTTTNARENERRAAAHKAMLESLVGHMRDTGMQVLDVVEIAESVASMALSEGQASGREAGISDVALEAWLALMKRNELWKNSCGVAPQSKCVDVCLRFRCDVRLWSATACSELDPLDTEPMSLE